eukprot:4644851-Alexandrium_andersonii.AAC.1
MARRRSEILNLLREASENRAGQRDLAERARLKELGILAAFAREADDDGGDAAEESGEPRRGEGGGESRRRRKSAQKKRLSLIHI